MESPLLRLPLEVREKIYEDLLGARLLHIEYTHWQHAEYDEDRMANWPDPDFCDECRLTCVSCMRDANQDTNPAVDGDCEGEYYYKYHDPCIKHLQPPTPLPFIFSPEPRVPWPALRSNERIPNQRALDVTLLRCCRQLYNECNSVLWNRNIFSFNNPWVFLYFMRNLHTARRGQMRNMQLHVSEHVSHIWRKACKLVESMGGLRSLDLIAFASSRHDWALEMMTDSTRLHRSFEFLLWFRILPIKYVQVRIEQRGRIWENDWTKADRIAIAEIIRGKVADVEDLETNNKDFELLQRKIQARSAGKSERGARRIGRIKRKQGEEI